MEMLKLREASDRAVEFFKGQLDGQGRLKNKEVCADLAAIYKLPYLLVITGNGRLAHKVLDDIKARFMQEDGDFLSFPDRKGNSQKSDNQEQTMFWPYMNTWLAMAAHKLGRFDISYPAWAFIKQFYNPVVGGFATSGRYDVTSNSADGQSMWSTGSHYDVGIFMTSHLALAALMFGDVEKAKASGDLMVKMVEQQPALDQYFLLHVSGDTGQLLSQGADSLRLYYRLLTNEPKELFFQLGYPVYFLHHLYQATKQVQYLQTAEKLLDFVLTCHQGFYTSFLHHKVAWGAALVAKVTGKVNYRRMSEKCLDFLLSLQTSEGDMLRELGHQPSLDQSAEIPIWFCELYNVLQDPE